MGPAHKAGSFTLWYFMWPRMGGDLATFLREEIDDETHDFSKRERAQATRADTFLLSDADRLDGGRDAGHFRRCKLASSTRFGRSKFVLPSCLNGATIELHPWT